MHAAHRELANCLISSEASQESVGNKVNLEFPVGISAHQVTYTDDLCIESTGNSFQYGAFRKELRTDVFIGNALSDIQIIFPEDSVHRRNTIRTFSCNGYSRNLDQPAAVVFTELNQILNTMDVDLFQYITGGKVLHTGCTVNQCPEFIDSKAFYLFF